MKQVIVFAVIFPANLPYFNSFLESLEKQSYKDFEVLLLNDGVANLPALIKDRTLSIQLLSTQGTPAEIRSFGMERLKERDPECVVFCDTDDGIYPDRIEQSVKALQEAKLVCNDLDIANSELKVTYPAYWANRLADGFHFGQAFLLDKNIVGLGNTAIHGSLLKKEWHIDGSSSAPDWHFFWQLLKDEEGVFIHSGKTLYRQHNLNTIGLQHVDIARLKTVIAGDAHAQDLSLARRTFASRDLALRRDGRPLRDG